MGPFGVWGLSQLIAAHWKVQKRTGSEQALTPFMMRADPQSNASARNSSMS